MQPGLPQAQPAVGEELVDLRNLRGGGTSEHILHVLEGIYVQALAGFDQAQDCSGSFSTLFGAGEEPVTAAENQRLYAAFATVFTNFDIGMIEAYKESRPAIEGVSNRFTEFCFGKF